MAITIDSNGISIETFDEIYARLSSEFKSIYGSDINLDQDTPDGQLLGILAKEILDTQEFAVNLYNSFDPDLASGQQQNKILKLSGLNRSPATKSTVSINITTSQTVNLPSDYTLSDSLGQNWVILSAQTLTAGTTAVDFTAEQWGAIEADADTITEEVTKILGVTSVTNPLAADPGLNEETDTEVRARRNKSIENPSYSTVGDLYARLLEIAGVTDVIIYENDTDTYDATLALDAHSIWCVIDGGTTTDITEAIAKSKTGGTGLRGSTTGEFTETIIKPDGGARTFIHTSNFDRPTETPIYITLNVKKKDTSLIDTDAIEDALVAETFDINEGVSVTSLYASIYSAGSNFYASDLLISDDDITYVDDYLAADYDEKFIMDAAKITITEI
jgi:uncharacterized phage protein gp47/JayE